MWRVTCLRGQWPWSLILSPHFKPAALITLSDDVVYFYQTWHASLTPSQPFKTSLTSCSYFPLRAAHETQPEHAEFNKKPLMRFTVNWP